MIEIRKAEKNDLTNIVELHIKRFSSFFLTSLGRSFLKVFYHAFLNNPGILLVLEDEGQIRGFAAGSRDNRGFFKKLLKNNLLGFLISGARILVTNPLALKRIAVNAGKAKKNNLIFAELLSIATLENKNGYGKILLNEFEKEVARKNYDNLPVSLTTDYANNDKAVQFYRDCGYEIHEVFESYQHRRMYRFLKYLSQN